MSALLKFMDILGILSVTTAHHALSLRFPMEGWWIYFPAKVLSLIIYYKIIFKFKNYIWYSLPAEAIGPYLSLCSKLMEESKKHVYSKKSRFCVSVSASGTLLYTVAARSINKSDQETRGRNCRGYGVRRRVIGEGWFDGIKPDLRNKSLYTIYSAFWCCIIELSEHL